MLQKILLFIGISAGLFLTSCQEDITLEVPPYENKLAVYCVLQPDSLPRLFLNRSKSYFNYTDRSLEQLYIKDAQVIIKDLSSGQIDTLRADSGYITDNFGSTFYGQFYMGKYKAQIGHKYSLDIRHKEKHVTAETIVPTPVSVNRVEYKIDNNGSSFNIFYTDNATESNAYNLVFSSFYTYFDGQQNITIEQKQRENSYKYDKLTNGSEMISDYFTDYDIRMGLGDTGAVYISLENNTTQTAEYLESILGQVYNGSDNFFTEPSIVKHNIVGGLGVFGATTPGPKYRVEIK